MVDPETAAYAFGTLGLLAGVVVGVALLRAEQRDRGRFGVLLVIPGFAALAYLVMFLGVGTVTASGYTFPVPRYVDWAVTTPVLVGYVGYVAGADRRVVVGTAVVDALMIALGLAAVLAPPPLRWVAFGLSATCHLGLLGVLYGVFPRAAADQSVRRRQLFDLLQNHVGLLWLAYPVVWLAGPAGLDLVSAVGITLVVTYADVVAKTPYLYFVWAHRSAFDAEGSGEATADSGDRSAVAGTATGAD
jgi:sensory rhodopsin